MNSRNTKRMLFVTLAVVLIAAALLGVYWMTRPPKQVGTKAVTLSVVDAEGNNIFNQELKTDAVSLAALLDENELAGYISGSYGRYIVSVCGVTADESMQQWWHIAVNGQDAQVGCDEQAIVDGDSFVLTLKTGY